MLLRQTLQTLPAQIAAPLAMLAAAVVWTHFLEPAELGAYAIAWAVQDFVYLLTLMWWSAWVQRYGSAEAERDPAALDSGEYAVQIVALLVQASVTCGVLLATLGAGAWPLLLPAAAFSVTRSLSMHLAIRARTRLQTGPFTILQTFGPVLGMGFGLALAGSGVRLDAGLVLWAYAAAQALGLAAAIPMLGLKPVWPRPQTLHLAKAYRFGGPLIFSSLCEWTGVHGVRFIVEAAEGAAAVGLITAGWWLGIRLATFVTALTAGASFNVAVERRRAEGDAAAAASLSLSGLMMLGLIAPAVTGGSLLAHELSAVLVAEPYQAMTAAILPMALAAGALKAFREHVLEQGALVFERVGLAVTPAVAEAAGTLAFAAAGLHFGGLPGAILGCLCSSALTACASYVAAARIWGFRLEPGAVLRLAAATGAMAAAVIYLPRGPGWPGLALAVGAGGAVYALALAVLFPALVRQAVRRLRRET